MRKLMWLSIGFAFAAALRMYLIGAKSCLFAALICALLLIAAVAALRRFPKMRIAVAVLLGCTLSFAWISAFDAWYLQTARDLDEQSVLTTVTAVDHSEETDYGAVVDAIAKFGGKYYRVRVYLPEDSVLSPGDRLTDRFTFRSTLPACSADSSYNRSYHVFLTAKSSDELRIDTAERLPWYGYPAYVREKVSATLARCMTDDTAGFVTALLIGERDGIDYATNTAFKISGISHIIAVSGLHVSILFALISFLTRHRRLPTLLVGIPMLLFFAAVADFSPSILRACIMHVLMMTAMLLEKEYDPPTALGFAALVMLFVDPWTITSVSFQLSMACMAGIFLLTEPITAYLTDKKRLGRFRGRKKKLCDFFASSVGASLGATVLVTPLCAYYFGMVSIVSILTNLLTLWIISFIFYGGMLVCVAGLIWPWLGSFLGMLLAFPVRYVLGTAKLLASFPLSAVYTDSVYIVFWLVFVYVLLAIHLLAKKKNVLTFSCCAVIGLCIALTASWTAFPADECSISVLDVGQGQCIILQSEGKTFVVDCGGSSDTDAADTAANELMSRGIFRIDGLILTHFDRDHAAGVQYLLQRIDADVLYLPTCADDDGTADTISDAYRKIWIDETTILSYGDTRITLVASENATSDNESGLCILCQTENCAILITGDRSMDGEAELMRRIDLPPLDVLVVGHHGSKYSTSYALLKTTQPRFALISVGANNTYGHPTQEVLERLAQYDCIVYRTDQNGKIIYRG